MLSDSVDVLKGVGEKFKADLAQMHLYTIEDLLYNFPMRYDTQEIKGLAELVHDTQVTLFGAVIHEPTISHFGYRKSKLNFLIDVEGIAIKAVMFNRAFAKKQLPPGTSVTLTGKWDAHRLQITVSRYLVGEPSADVTIGPIYSIRGDVTHYRLKNVIKLALDNYAQEIEEILPAHYLTEYRLPTKSQAIRTLHLPEDQLRLKHAKRRFTYEEFLLFQLKIKLLRKINRDSESGLAQVYDKDKVDQFVDSFPFTFTQAQMKVVGEMLADMQSVYEMNRLLQGDVGSGKTAVAAVGLYAAITAGNQGALMVPTEILAEQHYQSLTETFGDKAKIALLTSSIKGKKRQEVLGSIQANEVDIVVGTHSLIQDEVIFHQLGLVIIDEQHRFGVEQRRTLKNKGLHVDVLFMTATPIPRTLAITAFGDMDVSVINEMPKGRKEIETHWVKENVLTRVLEFIKGKIENKEQAYIVTPLIEESETFDFQNAIDLYEKLTAYYPAHIKIGLLHGRLSAQEKDDMMQQFADNEIHLLVSTTVIEVGVNVPNATVMVIYDAERFGLSQLHQLRGRVGRADKQSYCILIADPKGKVGRERMKIMTETNDGFALSEADLKMRGPGDFFGKKQSGLPEFKVADMLEDYRALEVARVDAEEIIEGNLLEIDPVYKGLKDYLDKEAALATRLD